MTEDDFWELVERSRGHSPDPGRRLAWLEERLVRLPLSEIADFQVRQDETRLRSDYLATTAYERLTGDEDGLSDALDARGHETPYDTAPADPSWDFDDPAEIARRLPRLSALFPARARG